MTHIFDAGSRITLSGTPYLVVRAYLAGDGSKEYALKNLENESRIFVKEEHLREAMGEYAGLFESEGEPMEWKRNLHSPVEVDYEDCTCDEGWGLHECPFSRAVYEERGMCTCCPSCTMRCADNI